ncbi:multidrug resistance protein [Polyplosphaeria fusca]|uniref:Multidrug resistance protein n=1 Tax=Polyplosphaeria fusca TaxID=682080 RepID=A0A9P4QKT8_9PLEO|nr:multidrug resistance protein [Polyplosphaeria fusca]
MEITLKQRTLWSFATPLDLILRFLAACAAAGSGTAEPLMAIFFGNLVNLFNGIEPSTPENFRSEISKNSLYIVYLFIGKFVSMYIGCVLFNYTSNTMASRIRLRYLRTVLHQSISYFDTNSPGSIATSLATETNMAQVGLSEKLSVIFQVISMVITAFTIAFTRNWKLTLVSATVVPYMVVSIGFFGGWSAQTEQEEGESVSKAAGIAEEALSSIQSITALGASEKVVRKVNVHLTQASRLFKHTSILQAGIYGNMFFSVYCAYALALFYGCKLIKQRELINGGDVVTVLFCVIMASTSMGMLAPIIPDFTKAGAAAQQIIQKLESSRASQPGTEKGPHVDIDSLKGDIELRNVSFAYPERPAVMVLDDLSLIIPHNKVTAIVGHSGSGKSTLVGLIERWYPVEQGIIAADGHDIRDLDLQWWRTQIGFVQQGPILFNQTIYENVVDGLRGPTFQHISDDEKRQLVSQACKLANAHNFIKKLPQGYDTSVGERAGFLSGGQKQRIAIARSIISNPKILLLDEATSSLDAESEKAVLTALRNASAGRTTVMIAHKLSTIAHADNIAVLCKGRLVEQGSHHSLVALNGHYARLLQEQVRSTIASEPKTHDEEIRPTKTSTPEPTQPSNLLSTNPDHPNPTTPLETPSISRHHTLLRCTHNIYTEHPSLLYPTTLALLAALAGGATYPLQALLFSRLVTVFQDFGPDLTLRGNFWALMFFVVGLSNLLIFLVLFYCMGTVGAKLAREYRVGYLRAMLRQDIGFFQGNTAGGLTALLARDGAEVGMLFGSSWGLFGVFGTCLVACGVLAIAVYWKLGLVGVFGCLPTILGAGFFRVRIAVEAQDRCASAYLESSRYSTEAIAGIRTVSSLTMEGKIEGVYQRKLQAASASSMRKSMGTMALYALSDSLTLAATALTFWYGGRLVSFGELSVTQFFIIFTAIIFGGQASGFMFGFTNSITKAHAAMNRILYLTHSRPPINSSTGLDPQSSPHEQDQFAIELKSIHFRYPTRPTIPVLRDLSLSVPRGSHICIVGPSGCGKSTILSLLLRFYDIHTTPTTEKSQNAGQILVHGREITDWDIAALRRTIGYVGQETSLFQGTIRENILLGLDETECSAEEIESRVERACRQAYIHDFITSLPHGYATELGARGVALSGGQRQRIALARCLIREPEILLLDEATSGLDGESEGMVWEALGRARRERVGLTVVSVSHQTGCMRDAERVFVMEGGGVVEEGVWEELMGRRGRLWGMVGGGEGEG